jgi:hypothetical protein
VGGSSAVAETYQPYVFAASRPHSVRDPSGLFIQDVVAIVSGIFNSFFSITPAFTLVRDQEREKSPARLIPFTVVPPEQTIIIQKGNTEQRLLDPTFRRLLSKTLYALAVKHQTDPIVVWGFRTIEEQTASIERGKSPVGSDDPSSPNASFHLFGRAADEVDRRYYWNDGSMPFFQTLGSVAESYGLRWGGRFLDKEGRPKPDWAHVQCWNRVGPCL